MIFFTFIGGPKKLENKSKENCDGIIHWFRRSLIFHDFPWLTLIFQVFLAWILKFWFSLTFQVFHDLYKPWFLLKDAKYCTLYFYQKSHLLEYTHSIFSSIKCICETQRYSNTSNHLRNKFTAAKIWICTADVYCSYYSIVTVIPYSLYLKGCIYVYNFLLQSNNFFRFVFKIFQSGRKHWYFFRIFLAMWFLIKW